jgi:hypothetical protein
VLYRGGIESPETGKSSICSANSILKVANLFSMSPNKEDLAKIGLGRTHDVVGCGTVTVRDSV